MNKSKTNPLVQEIRNLLYNDMSKSDIRKVISGWLPSLSKQDFDVAFTEATQPSVEFSGLHTKRGR